MISRKEYLKQYYELNKEKMNKRASLWNSNNKEKHKSFIRNWNLNNTEKVLLNTIKHRAIKANLEINIEESDIIIPEVCPIFNIKMIRKLGKGRQPFNPSIDRIDPSKGYIKGNIWVISDLANRMKQEATKEELIAFAKGVLKYYGRKTNN